MNQALRRIARSPGFALTVILTIALGAGVNASMFSLVESVLVRPLPYPRPDRLVRVMGTVPDRGVVPWVSPPDLADMQSLTGVFEHIGGARANSLTLTGRGAASRIEATWVTSGFLPALGVRPVAGRTFDDGDFRTGRALVGLLGESAARKDFGDPAKAIGADLVIDGHPIRVVGVLPDRADVLESGTKIWMPLYTDEGRGSHSLIVIGRLANGVTIGEARSALDVLASRLAAAYPESNAGRGCAVTTLRESIVGSHRGLLVMLQLAAIAVLLIAAANAGVLAFARFVSRGREMAVRSALGGSRARLVSSMLGELFLLGIGGGVAGFMLAFWTTKAIVSLSPFDLPRRSGIHPDATVFVVTLLAAIGATVLAGIGPAIRSATGNSSLLREGLGAISLPRGRRLARDVAVAVTIALSVALVGSATALGRSLSKLLATNTGFSRHQITAFDVTFPDEGWERARRFNYDERMLERLEAVPGASRVGAISMLPFGGGNLCADMTLPGAAAQPDCSELRFVSPGLFATLGIPILEGRGLDRSDTRESQGVAIVNATFARQFPRARLGGDLEWNDRVWKIVGIVGDVHTAGLDEKPGRQVYLSLAQATPTFMGFVVRSEPGRTVSPSTIRRVAEGVDPGVVVRNVATMDRLLDQSVAAPRFRSVVVSSIALLALILSMVGLYGTIAHLVSERRREIAVRVALGATAGSLVRTVLSRGGRIVGVGMVAGLGLLAVASRFLGSWLFGMSALDPWTLLTTLALLALGALAACVMPVRRALIVDPVVELRTS